jgi:hypothetical protein
MTGTDYTLCTPKSVPVIFEPPCMLFLQCNAAVSVSVPI